MIRAVLDANVLVSGIVTEGVPRSILKAWRAGHFHLVASPATLDEISRVLRYPKIARRHHWSEAEIRAFMESLAALVILTPGELRLEVIEEDPADDRYLECAVEGEAACLVTGDRHLLKLGAYQSIEILSPREFVELLATRR
ncbi:MAG TPA: putative toxin-antitoxin system toxin component, PIN family [Bryobacteraceae bacterium]|jgi:putative PIN family toxin of toxin-antitoxin system|nr:putative toxin-antitoxin system toxin component, PIN family [Bryobacteraceae bacterium]